MTDRAENEPELEGQKVILRKGKSPIIHTASFREGVAVAACVAFVTAASFGVPSIFLAVGTSLVLLTLMLSHSLEKRVEGQND